MEDPFLFSHCSNVSCCIFDHLHYFAVRDFRNSDDDNNEFGGLLLSEDITARGIGNIVVPNEQIDEPHEVEKIVIQSNTEIKSTIVECNAQKSPLESQIIHVTMDLDSLHSSSSTTIPYDDDKDTEDNESEASSLNSSTSGSLKSPYHLRYSCSMKRKMLQERKLHTLAVERIATFVSSMKRRSPNHRMRNTNGTHDQGTNVISRDYKWSRYELGLIARLLRGYTKEDALPNVDFAHRVLSTFRHVPTTTTTDNVGSKIMSFNATREDLRTKFGKLRAAIGKVGKFIGGGAGSSLYTSILDFELNSLVDTLPP